MNKLALTPADVAAQVDRPVSTVLMWCRTGQMPAKKVGKYWLISPEVFSAWLKGGTPAEVERAAPQQLRPHLHVPRKRKA